MGKMKYTVTTTTKRCPRCGEVLEEDTKGCFTPIIAIFAFWTLPFYIGWFLVNVALDYPSIPKIKTRVVTCPNCSLPVCTYHKSYTDLSLEERLAYQFRGWIYLSYVLGGVVLIGAAGFVPFSVFSWYGLVWFLLLAGLLSIIIVYRRKLSKCK